METASYTFQPETQEALSRIPAGTVSYQSANIGISNGEPLLLALDGLLRYAKAHAKRYGSPLAEDYVLGVYWLDALKGLRGLLNGDGAVALELDRSTDSKDNGALDTVAMAAIKAAGFTEEDL